MESEHIALTFIGERHGNAPVKRFAVDLANALVARGHRVGLYVEGFRVGCAPHDARCNRLAHAFNWSAYADMRDRSRAAVHPIDPIGKEHRAQHMAAAIASGAEEIRIVLIGTSHMIFAADPDARYPIFGGQLSYANPGDVAESFPRHSYLTIGTETAARVDGSYALRRDGIGADYVLVTE